MLDTHFQVALASDHAVGYVWFPFSELRDYRVITNKKDPC